MTLAEHSARLSAASRRHHVEADAAIDWPEVLERPAWFTSPDLVSIAGTPRWDALDEVSRQELSFWEAVNFYSLNIHGERILMEGLASRLYRPELLDVTRYLHHMLDEENRHSVWFGTFCTRYAGRIYQSRQVRVAAPSGAREDTFLFFAMVLVFEEVVDQMNVAMMRDERLASIAQEINRRHHLDEARHLSFGRRVVEHLWQEWSVEWEASTIDVIRSHLEHYVVAMWRDHYNPNVYRDAGLDDVVALSRQAWEHPVQRERRQHLSREAIAFLLDLGVLEREPSV